MGLAVGRIVVAVLAAAMLLTLALVAAVTGVISNSTIAGIGLTGCHLAEQTDLDPEQAHHATVIIQVGQQMQVPQRGWVIAIATALQESGLRNLPHQGEDNDHDSLGLFQQRPSQGWGTPEQILDPQYAASAFYQRLLEVPAWEDLPLTIAAQEVQRSAHPNAYAPHEPNAQAIVAAYLASGDPREQSTGCHPVVSADGWAAPVIGGQITSGFRTEQRPSHNGVDLAAPRGTPVYAAAAGYVSTIVCQASLNGVGIGCDRDGSPDVTGCGWYIELLHRAEDPIDGDETMTRYCHLLQEPELEIGQQVEAGQPIGLVGSSGNSSGPHLHFEVHHRIEANDVVRVPVDPVPFLTARGVAVDIEDPWWPLNEVSLSHHDALDMSLATSW